MSAAPRPHKWPSATVAENGGKRQREESPGGTTSVWPAKTKFGAARPKRAQRLATVGWPGSANETISVGEAGLAEQPLDIAERPAVLWRHRGKCQQGARDIERRGERSHRAAYRGRISRTTAAQSSATS